MIGGQTCSVTFDIPKDARDAGYKAACPNCGRLFKTAEEWADTDCQPREVKADG